jgi:invasion protein IalB
MVCSLIRLSIVPFTVALFAVAAIGRIASAEDAVTAAQEWPGPGWVKRCESVPLVDAAAKDPRTVEPVARKACVTEFYDNETGRLLVVAVREIEGQSKKSLLIHIPLNVALTVSFALQFDGDKGEARVVWLPYSYCDPAGCNSESEATPEIIGLISKSKIMTVLVETQQGTRVRFRIALDNFASAFAGVGVDSQDYMDIRRPNRPRTPEQYKAISKARQAAIAEAIKSIKDDLVAGTGSGDASTHNSP